jgi:hypothetical protein
MKDLTPEPAVRPSKSSLEIPLFARRSGPVREDALVGGPPDLKCQRKILIYICLHSQVGGDLLVSRNLRKMRK